MVIIVKVVLSPKGLLKSGSRYYISVPAWIAEKLQGKPLKVTIETLELEEVQKKI